MPTLDANGITLSYSDRGEGEPILFICGTGQPAALLDLGLRPALEQAGYRTITFDNRGMAPTSVPEGPYTVGQMADDAIALVEHLNIGPCRILGSSLGGLVAQTIAVHRPDLVRSAVLNIGAGDVPYAVELRLAMVEACLRAGGDAAQLAWRENMLDVSLPPAQRGDEVAVKRVLTMLAKSYVKRDDWTGLAGQMGANAAWAREEHLEELATVTAPCLVIGHEHDTVFPPAGIEAAARMIPNGELLMVPGAPHVSLSRETGQLTMPRILDFFARH